MEVNFEFYSKNQQNRLMNDLSWKHSSVLAVYDYTDNRKVHVYHRIFGDIQILCFPKSKKQIWTFIGSSEIPFQDDFEIPPKIYNDNQRFREYIMKYTTKVLKSRIRAL